MPSKSQVQTIQNFAQKIVDTVREPLLILDASLRVRSANRAFYQMFQADPQTTEDRLIYELGNGQWDIPALRTLLENSIREHSVFNDFELTYDFPVLGRRILLLNARKLRADRHTEMLVLAIEDITDRRRVEENAAKALEAAETASHTKSLFLANMSHELRTPLNAILGYSEMLQEEAAEKGLEKMAADLQRVHSAGTHLLGLINDMLDLSKIEAGKMTFEAVNFNLRDAMEEIAELLAYRAQEKGLELLCFLPPDFPVWLRGDEGRIRQIVTNLLANAIKFTDHGEVTLKAHALRETTRSVLVRVAVQDTGIGIPKERHKAIFESFTQADAGITQRFGGTGLGLTISRQLAELMGGRVGLESEPGLGSLFWVELLLRKQERPREQANDQSARLKELRVLIADPNAANRRLLHDQLTAWGCRATEAKNSSEVVELLADAVERSDPFRVALLCRNLSPVSGLELEQAIRADGQFDALSLVLISGVTDRETGSLHERSFSAFLTKPVRQKWLLQSLLKAVKEPRATPQQAAKDAAAQSAIDLAGLRVLLAEDNKVNTLLARHWLQRWNCEVTAVENGVQVVEAAQRGVYDVILMDVEMPEMDGFEATGQIREAEVKTGWHIPIIAMTAHSSAGDRKRCLEHGMDDYVSKPIRPLLLQEALERWQADRTVRPNARRQPAPADLSDPALAGEDTAADVSEAPLFDMSGLLDRCDGDMNFAETIMREFVRTAPAKLQQFLSLLDTGDRSAIHRAAHTLKGTVSMVGGVRLGHLYQELENRTLQDDFAVPMELLPRILEQHTLLVAAIENCLAERRIFSQTK